MKTRTLLLAAALMAVTAAPAYADSASFNCAYAKTPDEVTICNSQELTDLDATLAQLFFPLRNQMSDPQRQKFNAEEASWLRYRMSCGADTQCITNAYKGRIDVLENIRHVAALTKGRNPTPAGTPTTAAPYDTFSGVLISGQGDLVLNFKENGEFVEGAVFLPRVERHRILRACKLNQPCTVIGITGPPTPKCGPDCANVVKIISVFAGNIRE